MKIIYPKDNNGNLIGFKTNEKNVYRTSDGANLSSILKNINDRIDQLNGPFNVADRIYYNENNSTLEMYAGDTLLSSTEVIAGGSDTPLFPPPNVSDITVEGKNGKILITWTDPSDIVVDGITITNWAGTRVVVKAGSIPTDISDGVSITDSTTRNMYQTTPLEIGNLVNDVTYYVRFFPYSDGNIYNMTLEGNIGSAATKSRIYTVYGFHITPNDSNPSTAVTYLEDAIGKTPVSMNYSTGVFNWGDWSEDEFFMPRPCMVKYNMTVDYYLNPNDYTKKVDGTASGISNTSYQGNAMMEWGRDGYKIWYKVVPDSDNANGASIYISNGQEDSDYKCWNFYDSSNTLRDHFYTAIYNGSYISSRMRSLSGQTPGLSQTATTEISYARSNNTAGNLSGDRWYTETFGDRTLINYLLVLLGKSLDTQAVYGYGYANNNSSAINTGTMNTKGLFWGENTGVYGVKVFGMENYWGNVTRHIAGLMSDVNNIYVKLTPNTADGSSSTTYTTSVTGMINTGVTSNQVYNSYCRYYKYFSNGYSVMNDAGTSGSNTTTYYCDTGVSSYSSTYTFYAHVGGAYWSSNGAGAFNCVINASVSESNADRGAALSGR